MKAIAVIAAALALGLSAAEAGTPASSHSAGLNAQAKATPHRARTRIVVRPRYPYRTYHTLYPPPYDVEYPGPNAHRECAGGFATEYRASGTVIVPRMNCRWARGGYPGP